MKESEKKKKGQARKTATQLFSLDQGKETKFLANQKIPKSEMWLATSLIVTKLKLETESHADKQTCRITKDSVFTIYDHKLKLRMKGIV